MPHPIQPSSGLNPISPIGPVKHATGAAPEGEDFASLIRGQLEKVSEMQSEADLHVENLVTGQSDSVTEVFVAARRAEVAFSLLMEIRNKLVDAYDEIKNLRV